MGEVNELSGALGSKAKGAGGAAAAGGGARAGVAANNMSEATRLRALELYNGYLGKETNVRGLPLFPPLIVLGFSLLYSSFTLFDSMFTLSNNILLYSWSVLPLPVRALTPCCTVLLRI